MAGCVELPKAASIWSRGQVSPVAEARVKAIPPAKAVPLRMGPSGMPSASCTMERAFNSRPSRKAMPMVTKTLRMEVVGELASAASRRADVARAATSGTGSRRAIITGENVLNSVSGNADTRTP
jgi:hypothetical protein